MGIEEEKDGEDETRPYLIKDHHLISFFYHQLSVLRVTFKVIHHSSLW